MSRDPAAVDRGHVLAPFTPEGRWRLFPVLHLDGAHDPKNAIRGLNTPASSRSSHSLLPQGWPVFYERPKGENGGNALQACVATALGCRDVRGDEDLLRWNQEPTVAAAATEGPRGYMNPQVIAERNAGLLQELKEKQVLVPPHFVKQAQAADEPGQDYIFFLNAYLAKAAARPDPFVAFDARWTPTPTAQATRTAGVSSGHDTPGYGYERLEFVKVPIGKLRDPLADLERGNASDHRGAASSSSESEFAGVGTGLPEGGPRCLCLVAGDSLRGNKRHVVVGSVSVAALRPALANTAGGNSESIGGATGAVGQPGGAQFAASGQQVCLTGARDNVAARDDWPAAVDTQALLAGSGLNQLQAAHLLNLQDGKAGSQDETHKLGNAIQAAAAAAGMNDPSVNSVLTTPAGLSAGTTAGGPQSVAADRTSHYVKGPLALTLVHDPYPHEDANAAAAAKDACDAVVEQAQEKVQQAKAVADREAEAERETEKKAATGSADGAASASFVEDKSPKKKKGLANCCSPGGPESESNTTETESAKELEAAKTARFLTPAARQLRNAEAELEAAKRAAAKVQLLDEDLVPWDDYSFPLGLRTISWLGFFLLR